MGFSRLIDLFKMPMGRKYDAITLLESAKSAFKCTNEYKWRPYHFLVLFVLAVYFWPGVDGAAACRNQTFAVSGIAVKSVYVLFIGWLKSPRDRSGALP